MSMEKSWQRRVRGGVKPGSKRAAGRRPLAFEGLETRELLATLFVATSGSDAGAGTVDSPYRNIQRAVTAASSGDEIRVASGTYYYDSIAEVIDSKRNITYSSILKTQAVVSVYAKQLTLEGGYTTTNWAVANPAANPTIIDGQGGRRGVLVVGFDAPTGLDLEGFTIQNGLGTGIAARGGGDAAFGFGGGIFIDMGGQQSSTAPFTFRDMVFRNNTARASSPVGDEGGRGAGGAIAFRYARNVTIERTLFEGNTAQGGDGAAAGGGALGGALHLDHSSVTGVDVVFRGNLARSGNSSGDGRGSSTNEKADALGGAAAVQAGSTLSLTRATATGNRAIGGNAGGEGGDAYGGAFFAEYADANLAISGSFLQGNVAQAGNGSSAGSAGGGAIMLQNSGLSLLGSRVVGNAVASGNGAGAVVGGGGIYLARYNGAATHSITSTVIADNGVALGPNTTGSGGGAGVWLQGVNATITHATFDNNHLDSRLAQGRAIYLVGGGMTATTLSLNNSILSNHSGGRVEAGSVDIQHGTTGSVTFNNVLTFNEQSLIGTTTNSAVNGLNTVRAAGPSAALPSLYNAPGSPYWDYHLVKTGANPAIDAAVGSTTALDLDGNPRGGAAPDLGAAEAIAPRFEFAGPVAVGEGDVAQIVVVRRGDLSAAGSVQVVIQAGGSAAAGTDYQPFAGNAVTVTFAPYEESKVVSLATGDNATANAAKTINIALQPSPAGDPNNRIGALGATTVTILDVNAIPSSPNLGFVAEIQPLRNGKGVVGARIQFNAALSKASIKKKLARAFALRKLSGRGAFPKIRSARYLAGSSTVVLRFSRPLRTGSSALLVLKLPRLKDVSGRSLAGANTFTFTA